MKNMLREQESARGRGGRARARGVVVRVWVRTKTRSRVSAAVCTEFAPADRTCFKSYGTTTVKYVSIG